jgi:hypothetical protein
MTSLTPGFTRLSIALVLTLAATVLVVAGTINLVTARRANAARKTGDARSSSSLGSPRYFRGVRVKTDPAGSSLQVNTPLLTETRLTASDGAPGNKFGSAVAVSGNTAVVADDLSVYVFVRSNGIWTEQQKLSSVSHQYVAIDGNTLIAAGSNVLHVFVRNGDMWTSQQVIDLGNFTFSISVSGDTIVAGIPWDSEGCPSNSVGYRGAALVFVRNNGFWTQQQKLTASDGQCGGDPNGFRISGVTPYVHPGDFFGDSVSVSHDTLLIGAPNAGMGPNVEAGAAYVFGRNGNGSWSEQQKLRSTSPSLLGAFGSAVAVSNDTAVVGATGEPGTLTSPDQPGSAYVFGRSNGIWIPQQAFPAGAAPGCTYSFGYSVAVDGDAIVVGCNTDDIPGDPSGPPPPVGAASWFKRSGSSWIQQTLLRASDGVQGDNFGNVVAVSGPTILVGARRDDTASGADAGSAYVFEDNADNVPPTLTVPANITTNATSANGAVVNFVVMATDNLDPNPLVVSVPASGSLFPLGTTTVNSTATDASGNSASAGFLVNVLDATPTPTPSPCTPIPTPTPNTSLDHLQRSVALGAIINRGGSPPTQEDLNQNPSNLLFRYNPNPCATPDPSSNIEILKRSNTHWIRLWADWPTLQPSPPPDPNNPFGTIETDPGTAPFIQNLDEQIRTARKEGFGIILTAYRFPEWANNTAVDSSGLGRDPRFRVPTDLSVSSPWSKWIKFIIERYGLTNSKVDINNQGGQDYLRYIDFLEIVNEPNLQMWPQRNQSGLVMPRRVATMFRTAQIKLREVNASLTLNPNETTVKLAGPAVLDVGGGRCQHETNVPCQNEVTCTTYGRFTKELLRELRDLPFLADKFFAWSHHNYRDIECDREDKPEVRNGEVRDPNYPQTNSAAWVRRLLVVGVDQGRNKYEWDGWPHQNHPKLLITEGGARLDGVSAKYRISVSTDLPRLKRKQAALVKRNFNRMDNGDLSLGIALVNNYLIYTDPCHDSGLYDLLGSCAEWAGRICPNPFACTNTNPGGGIVPRPLYRTWSVLPPRQ